MNAKMPELKRSFEACGFADVRTILGSGNVVFSARSASERAVERKAELGMQDMLERTFLTIVRSIDALRELIEADPFARFRLPAGSKRVVTFLREPSAEKSKLSLPLTFHDARILAVDGREVFSTYVPGPKGPVFMNLIEKTFGKDVTTRTWDTVKKVTAARS